MNTIMTSETAVPTAPLAIDSRNNDPKRLGEALAVLGQSESARLRLFDYLRTMEAESDNPSGFRENVRWPIVSALLEKSGAHKVTIKSGLMFEVTVDSRIERAVLLSSEERPDHVWEPQTTRLLVALAKLGGDVVVGGAYIGDQVLPMAHAMVERKLSSVVHAFEPMAGKFGQLKRNIEINGLGNVTAKRMALWDVTGESLGLSGAPALANCSPGAGGSEQVVSTSIDDYVKSVGSPKVGLIMLDTEGGEERALRGASALLAGSDAPNLVFEVHREFVDWTNGLGKTPIIKFVSELGYETYAIRDYNDNYPMGKHPIEIIPVDSIYLEGPPHGFNMLAIKRREVIRELGISVVKDVSPKLLLNRDPRLHHPLS